MTKEPSKRSEGSVVAVILTSTPLQLTTGSSMGEEELMDTVTVSPARAKLGSKGLSQFKQTLKMGVLEHTDEL